MATVSYIWKGPACAVTLKSMPNDLDVIFIPGATVLLPEDNDYVKGLISQAYLVPAPVAPVQSGGNP